MPLEPPETTGGRIAWVPPKPERKTESAFEAAGWPGSPRRDSPQHPSSERRAPWGQSAFPAKTGPAAHLSRGRVRAPPQMVPVLRRTIRRRALAPAGRARSSPHSRLAERRRGWRLRAPSRTEARRDVRRLAGSAREKLRSAEVGSADHALRMTGCFGNRCQ